MAFERTAEEQRTNRLAIRQLIDDKLIANTTVQEAVTYVGVSSRSEFLDSTVWSNVFNAVSEGSFVEKGFTTTTTRLLLPTF